MNFLPKNKVYMAEVNYMTFLIPAILMALFLVISNVFFPSFYKNYVSEETGLLESLHIFIPVISIIIIVISSWKLRKILDASQKLVFVVLALGCLYIAGEEASWGQHYFQWDSHEWFETHNNQQETNLHNTSSWLDQKPRFALEIFIVFNCMIMPALYLYKGIGVYEKNIFTPLFVPPTMFFIAFIAFGFKWSTIFPFIEGIRVSEVSELYYYYFILIYVICFAKTCDTKTLRAA